MNQDFLTRLKEGTLFEEETSQIDLNISMTVEEFQKVIAFLMEPLKTGEITIQNVEVEETPLEEVYITREEVCKLLELKEKRENLPSRKVQRDTIDYFEGAWSISGYDMKHPSDHNSTFSKGKILHHLAMRSNYDACLHTTNPLDVEWITTEAAEELLTDAGVVVEQLGKEDKVWYTKPNSDVIRYDKKSIMKYLEESGK